MPEGEARTDFACNQALDHKCKAWLDNISKQARAAGTEAVSRLKAIKNDKAKLATMLQSYGKCYTTWELKGRSRSGVQWCAVTYVEEVEVTSAVEYVGERQMMWERHANIFWQSVEGSMMTEEEADAEWSLMVSRKDIDKTPYDYKGPARRPLRLAIKAKDVCLLVRLILHVGLCAHVFMRFWNTRELFCYSDEGEVAS